MATETSTRGETLRRRLAELTPEQLRERTEKATAARGRVAQALARVDELEARLTALEQRVAA